MGLVRYLSPVIAHLLQFPDKNSGTQSSGYINWLCVSICYECLELILVQRQFATTVHDPPNDLVRYGTVTRHIPFLRLDRQT